MTSKVGISSTRHVNPDFISKLESQEPNQMGGHHTQATRRHNEANNFVYRAAGDPTTIAAPGGTHATHHVNHHDLNSPKYNQQNNTSVLQEIMSLSKNGNTVAPRTTSGDDKVKKIKLVRADQ